MFSTFLREATGLGAAGAAGAGAAGAAGAGAAGAAGALEPTPISTRVKYINILIYDRMNKKNRATLRQRGGECPCASKMFGGARRTQKKRGSRTRKMRR